METECSSRQAGQVVETVSRAVLAVVFVALLVGVVSFPAQARVRIAQVVPDPARTDAGGEFVLLENTDNESVNMSGWQIATGSSIKDVTFPRESIILPHGIFLVADKGWNESRDNMSWPLADLEAAMTLANDDSGVALLLPNGSVVDAVGWGKNVTKAILFQGIPATAPEAGRALQRVADTGSNKIDFMAVIPDVSGRLAGSAQIVVDVTGSPALLLAPWVVNVEDDDPKPGVQLVPFPGAERLVDVRVFNTSGSLQGSSPDSVMVTGWNSSRSLRVIDGVWVGEIPLRYSTKPGIYTLRAEGFLSGKKTGEQNVSVEVYPVLSVFLDAESLPFREVGSRSMVNLSGDFDLSTTNAPTVWNGGNVDVALSVMVTDLQGSADSMGAHVVGVFVRRNRGPGDVESSLTTRASLRVGESAALDIQVAVPDVSAGTYAGRLWIMASRRE